VAQISGFRKIGILGGSFNPIHLGHLLMAETALEQFNLDQIIWVPSYHPPHKRQQLISFGHRWNMLQLAIADHPSFIASNVEQQRQTNSYASVTLAQLQILYPDACWFWILGSDAFQKLASWHHSAKFVDQCTWLVSSRGVESLQEIGQKVDSEFAQHNVRLRWHPISMPRIDISSSLIRQYCQFGRSLRYLVPESVRVYIDTHHLYQDNRPINPVL